MPIFNAKKVLSLEVGVSPVRIGNGLINDCTAELCIRHYQARVCTTVQPLCINAMISYNRFDIIMHVLQLETE